MTIDERRKRDREHKREQRRLNTVYAQRVREKKRSPEAKARRQELRQRPEAKAQQAAYCRQRRQREDAKAKERGRHQLRKAMANGQVMRPDRCEICNQPDQKRRDGKSGLRADHYLGYDHPTTVRFVCPTCDGKQEMERGNTTLGQVIATT